MVIRDLDLSKFRHSKSWSFEISTFENLTFNFDFKYFGCTKNKTCPPSLVRVVKNHLVRVGMSSGQYTQVLCSEKITCRASESQLFIIPWSLCLAKSFFLLAVRGLSFKTFFWSLLYGLPFKNFFSLLCCCP